MEEVFNKKRTYITDDGDELVDIMIPTININGLSANGFLRVSADQKGRIDKFSKNNVNIDPSAIDVLMYFNHIFNPFAIDEGDMLYTPVYDNNIFKTIGEPLLPDGSKHSNNANGEKELTYAEKVERAARLGLGVK